MKIPRGLGALPAAVLWLLGAAAAADTSTPASGLKLAPAVAAKPGASGKGAGLRSENAPRDPTMIRQSDKLRTGVLPNGLRYVLAYNDTPGKAVSVRLAIDAGTFDEADDERGAAHFVEHMAFAGAHSLNGDALSRAFEARGVEFARDLNANTDLYETVYRLDLPNAEPAGLDLAFRWLRDAADGTDFPDAVVARERGVILAERMGRMTADREATEALVGFQAPGLRVADRSRLDPAPSISTMDPARLRSFHERWYRPDRAVVVVVGDLPVDAMAERVQAAFGSWAARGPAPQRASPGAPDDNRGEAVMVRAEATTVSSLTACRVRAEAAAPVIGVDTLRRRMSERLWMDILNHRLTRLASGANPPFLRASMEALEDWRGVRDVCLTVTPLADAWRTAQDAAQAELRRFADQGPTPLEISQALDRLRSAYWDETGVNGPSPALATALAEGTLRGEPFPDEPEGQRVFELAFAGAGPETVKAAFGRDWSGSGPLIGLVAAAPPPAEAVRAAWDEGDRAPPLAAYVDERQTRWSYARFGWPGRVVARETVADGDFVRLTFANGVVLNLKITDFPDKKVEVRVRFGAGRREIPNGDYLAAVMGAGVFASGGLGRMDLAALREALADHSWSAQLKIEDDAFDLSGSTSPASLEVQLQLLAAYMTDPGFRSIDARLPTAIDAMYRMAGSNPAMGMSLALEQAMAPNGPNNLPSDPRALRMNSAQFEALLRPALRDAPLEVTIVGKVEEKQVVRAMSHTFGALPARKTGPRARDDTWFRRIPEGPIGPIHVALDGPEKAMTEDVWPLFVAGPENRDEAFTVQILSRILHDALLQRVRQELGKTYTPLTLAVLPDRSDQGYLVALLDASPADLDLVQGEIGRAAAALAHGQITQAELDEARAPVLAQLDASARTNAWWAGVLDGSAREPGDLAQALKARTTIEGISLEAVKASAARWLAPAPILVTAAPAAATPAAVSR